MSGGSGLAALGLIFSIHYLNLLKGNAIAE
jgi:hypothetical protein